MPSATSDLVQPEVIYGQRLLPSLIDEVASIDPQRRFLSFPKTTKYSQGLRFITVSEYARSINRAAWWLEKTLGKPTGFPTVAYIGVHDARYFILAVACMKVGYKLLLLSPRNSIAGHVHVLDKTDCQIFLKPSTVSIDHILHERPIPVFNIAELEDFLQEKEVPIYPFNKTFEEARNDPALILHSSGSTGPPKPIVLKHGSLCSIDANHLLPTLPGSTPFMSAVEGTGEAFAMLPPFHMGGIIMVLCIGMYFNVPSVLPPATSPVNLDMLLDVLDNVQLDGAFLSPSMVDEISRSPEALAKIEKLKWVWFGGGPLAKAPGDVVSEHAKLSSVIGTTESALFPLYTKDAEDWQYFHFNPSLKGIEFREQEDGYYEMFFVRDSETDKFHSTWYTFPDLKEYSTADLYKKHPTKAGVWLHSGRQDDVIVLNNGEKVVTKPLEDVIRDSPDVREVLLIGRARFEVTALIELHKTAQDLPRSEVLKRMSPYIKKANDIAPKFARLSKDRIMFTKADKPMVWLPKQTVSRKATLSAYDAEIEANYSGDLSSEVTELPPLLKDDDKTSAVNALLEIFGRVSDVQDLKSDQDVFRAGLDSLQVLNAARQIRTQLRAEKPTFPSDLVTPSLIYSNPTIAELADALRRLTEEPTDPESVKEIHFKRIEEMLATYAADMPKKNTHAVPKEDRLSLILTGSTGSLGSYLLDVLISLPQVEHVYCLNRAVNGEEKQKIASSSRQLSTSWGEKATFLRTDFSLPQFGLSTSDYKRLVANTSFIIHNQWPVDFNLSLASFEPHVLGVRRLIDFSADAPKRPPILFTSSVSTVGNWETVFPDTHAPEEPIHDLRVPFAIGYGESKHIAERLLEIAGQHGVSADICRVGQIAGPVEKGGVWNKQEWLPSIIASSAHLSLLPSSLGAGATSTVNWIPVDSAAKVVVELVHNSFSLPGPSFTSFHHISNPQVASWSTLIPSILARLPASTKVVSWEEWVQALDESAQADNVDPIANPGIKLLDFYREMSEGGAEGTGVLETDVTVRASGTMAGLRAVGEDWMGKWMEQWGFKGGKEE